MSVCRCRGAGVVLRGPNGAAPLVALGLAGILALTAPAFGQADHRTIFVANNGNLEGSVSAMAVHDDGTLSLINKVVTGTRPNLNVPCPGCNAYEISITPNGRYLATGHPSGPDPLEQVTIFKVAADGSIALAGAFLVPATPMDVAWITDDLLAVTRTDPNPNKVDVYRFDPNAVTLTLVDSKAVGTFSVYLAAHPSHEYLYVTDSGSADRIFAFRVAANGTLTLLETEYTGSYYPLELAISPDATKLYSAGGITYVELGYYIEQDGQLTAMAGSPFPSYPGASPSHVSVSSDNRCLIVGHGTDTSVRTFTIDPGTGALTYTGNWTQLNSYRSIGSIQSLDDLFFVSDGYTYSVYPFRLNSASGAFTASGPNVATGGIAPRGIAVWKPLLQKGDLNCDGAVNFDDINPFVLALSDPAGYAAAYPNCNILNGDINNDGHVNFDDINPFVALLTGP